jgi:hypothetical protein
MNDACTLSYMHVLQATSAFDGLQHTKWEEPNGAKGKVLQLHAFFLSSLGG